MFTPFELGFVTQSGDGIIYVLGLDELFAGELVTNGSCLAVILNIGNDISQAAILGSEDDVLQGEIIERSFCEFIVEASFESLGLVIDPLGNTITNPNSISFYPF